MSTIAEEAPYTTGDVARILGVTPRTIQKWCRQRRIEHRRSGTAIRFTAAQVKAAEAAVTIPALHPAPEWDKPNPSYGRIENVTAIRPLSVVR